MSSGWISPVTAAQEEEANVAVMVIEVAGFIDPVVVDFVRDAVTAAEQAGAAVLVIRLDSDRGVVAPAMLDRLVTRVRHAEVPVAVWVGEHQGATALDGAFELVEAAAMSGAVPGTTVGGRGGTPRMSAEEAVEGGVVDLLAPTLGDFIVSLDGRRVPGGGRLSIPTDVVRTNDTPQRRLTSEVQVGFTEPPLVAQFLHAVATPGATYVLFVLALLLVVFEFFTAGIGLLGVCGAGCGVLSAYGFGVLPTDPVGVGLVALGILAVAIDLQAGAPRAWTVIGFVPFVAGSLLLYDSGLRPPLLALVIAVGGLAILVVRALPVLIRVRFSTRNVDRTLMVGERGIAVTSVDARGTVQIRDAEWGAEAAAPASAAIAAGDPVRVVRAPSPRLVVEPDPTAART